MITAGAFRHANARWVQTAEAAQQQQQRKANLKPNGGPGRPVGAVAKITKDLKAGILNGAIAHGADGEGLGGLDGYLQMCATKYPKHYMQLLAKLLPLQVRADVANAVVSEVRIISVPADCYLSEEQIAKMNPALPLIEQEAIETEPAEAVIEAQSIEEEPEIEDVTAETSVQIIRASRRRR
jgi:hypothetical protein